MTTWRSLTPKSLNSLSEYVFLDSALPGINNKKKFFFHCPIKCITAFNLKDVLPALETIQQSAKKYWLAGYIRYEAAAAFLPSLGLRSKGGKSLQPLVWFGVYHKPHMISQIDDQNVFPARLKTVSQTTFQQYRKAILQIKDQLKRGNSYQVNLTYDIDIHADCSPEFLYFLLRQNQATPYCAMIKNKYDHVLSFSPELFFQRDGELISTQPMKGTAARGATAQEDRVLRNFLKGDQKNRAENLMIVDLLRNDFGKICQPGKVDVPSMFNIETHQTVHQMTSIVKGRLKDGVSYVDIFKAIFPCGSVTGAPKIKTMDIIQKVEKGKRGIYCGAIGYIAPNKKAVFSVPIRILQKSNTDQKWQYRVGSGIVWDSKVKDEWAETKIKTSFLTRQAIQPFELLETMLWDGEQMLFEDEHIMRLKQSARKLQFKLSLGTLKDTLKTIKSQYTGKQRIIRLLASKDGNLRFNVLILCQNKNTPSVKIADICLDNCNSMLKHKTTYRPWYADTLVKIKSGELWDEIYLNQDDEVCEGARSNVFIRKNGKLYTPPVSCGLLPGILRNDLLCHQQCEEKVLYSKDLRNADTIFCGNSVRGLTQVKLL